MRSRRDRWSRIATLIAMIATLLAVGGCADLGPLTVTPTDPFAEHGR